MIYVLVFYRIESVIWIHSINNIICYVGVMSHSVDITTHVR